MHRWGEWMHSFLNFASAVVIAISKIKDNKILQAFTLGAHLF